MFYLVAASSKNLLGVGGELDGKEAKPAIGLRPHVQRVVCLVLTKRVAHVHAVGPGSVDEPPHVWRVVRVQNCPSHITCTDLFEALPRLCVVQSQHSVLKTNFI